MPNAERQGKVIADTNDDRLEFTATLVVRDFKLIDISWVSVDYDNEADHG